MSFSLKVKGTDKVAAYLLAKNKRTNIEMISGVKKATLILEGEVKQSIAGHKAEPTSVDTGRFLNSVESKSSKDEGVVFSNVEHAKFLEYGTSRINARRHFRNSKSRNADRIKNIIGEEVSKI